MFDITQQLANMKLLDKQSKLLDAQANQANAEADYTKGAKTGATEADTLNTKVMTDINKLGLEIGKATKEDQIDKVTYEVEEIIKRNNLTDKQADLVKAQTLETGVKQKLHEANINLTDTQAKNITDQLILGYKELQATLDKISVDRSNVKMRGLEGKASLKAIEVNMMRAIMENEVAWGKLNVEQQKVFISMATSILSARN